MHIHRKVKSTGMSYYPTNPVKGTGGTMLAILIYLVLGSGALQVVPASPHEHWFASRILDATQMEYSPEFTDLYLIETLDKSRLIYIYCNSSSCYKVRGQLQFV
ncbi:hypothetical protein [Oceanobacter antarcticus]|uniref:Uncharacterized protein n=1 Tax=Oceanobacter antarcticus TaxID=3133425 RepID=A0ABW8NLP6_9GAMM